MKNIALVYGGFSKEAEISEKSAYQAKNALAKSAYNIYPIFISKEKWEMAPVYSVDLSRMLPGEKILPKSISISGINSSSMMVNYICCVEYEQTGFKVDVLTGKQV